LRDRTSEALRTAIGLAKADGREEVTEDDLLAGCLAALARFGTVRLGSWVIDVEELGIDWLSAEPVNPPKLAYSGGVVEVLDRAAMLARREGPEKISVEHILACFARETGGLMGRLRERYGIDSAGWRAALAEIAEPAEAALDAVPQRNGDAPREFLSPEEAAKFLGVHVQTLRGYIRSGKLPALRIAGERSIRIRRGSVEALLEPLPSDPVNKGEEPCRYLS
jgi:excisionase family DNA binding protein